VGILSGFNFAHPATQSAVAKTAATPLIILRFCLFVIISDGLPFFNYNLPFVAVRVENALLTQTASL
jgi:hypothetical protein